MKNSPNNPRRYAVICLVAFFLLAAPPPSFAATGHFDLYCDGVGLFLEKIDGAPAPARLVLFSRRNFPPGTMGGLVLGQGYWSDIVVYRDGCVPDGKCEPIAHGRLWIDEWYAPYTVELPKRPKTSPANTKLS